MINLNVFSAFDGMSCGQIALSNLGIIPKNYFASEIDKYAIKVTQANFPNTIQLGDIQEIDPAELPRIDLLIGGSPCQSFSYNGDGSGFDGKSRLFWEYVRLYSAFKRTNPQLLFLLENVRMRQEWQDVISQSLGVKPVEINSSLTSAQHRRRLYWTNLELGKLIDRQLYLKDIIEPDIERRCVKETVRNLKHERKLSQKSLTCLASMWKGAGNNGMTLIRRPNQDCLSTLTVREVERLQNVPDNYTDQGVSNTQRYKMLGNGWTIEIIEGFFKGLKNE